METPTCMHAGANASAFRAPVQGAACTGGRRASRPPAGQRKGFLCIHSIHLREYGAGLREDLLRDSGTRQQCHRYEYTRELPSVLHLGLSA